MADERYFARVVTDWSKLSNHSAQSCLVDWTMVWSQAVARIEAKTVSGTNLGLNMHCVTKQAMITL